MQTRNDEKIYDWYDAVDKIAEEAKQTGISSSRRAVEAFDLVQMNEEQRELIGFLWVNLIQEAALVSDSNNNSNDEKLQSKFWTTGLLKSPKKLNDIKSGILPFEKLQAIQRVQLLLLAIVRKSGIPLQDFYEKFNISKENGISIDQCLNAITNTKSECIDQLGISLREELYSLKNEKLDIKFGFESLEDKKTILDGLNRMYFQLLAKCPGAFISPNIKSEYLSDMKAGSAIVASPPYLGSGGCSRAAIAMGLLYMAYRGIEDKEFAQNRFSQESMIELAKLLKYSSPETKKYSSYTPQKFMFSQHTESPSLICKAIIDCDTNDSKRIEKIESAIAEYSETKNMYGSLVVEFTQLFMNGYIPEELRGSLLMYCDGKRLYEDIQNILINVDMDDNEKIKKALQSSCVSEYEIKELLRGYFKEPATPWLPDEITQKTIELFGGSQNGWLVPNEVKIATGEDVNNYNLTQQHTHVIFAMNEISKNFYGFEGRNIVHKDFYQTPSFKLNKF